MVSDFLACKLSGRILSFCWERTDNIIRYRQMSMFSLACGFREKAVGYAKKNLEVERYCIGTDTAYLEDDLEKSAESWLQHVKNELAKYQDTVAALAVEENATDEGSAKGKSKRKGKRKGKGNKKKPILEQATVVDSDLGLADDLDGTRVASTDVDDKLEDDASFARASAAAQGVHNRFNETTDEHATIQDDSAASEAGDSAADKGKGKGKGKGKRKLKRNRKGKGNKLDQSPDPSSTPVEPSSSGSRHEQATDVDPELADNLDGARVASTDDDDEAGWTKVGASDTGKGKGKGEGKKA